MDGVEKCQTEGRNSGVQAGRLATLQSKMSTARKLTDGLNLRETGGKNKPNQIYLCKAEDGWLTSLFIKK